MVLFAPNRSVALWRGFASDEDSHSSGGMTGGGLTIFLSLCPMRRYCFGCAQAGKGSSLCLLVVRMEVNAMLYKVAFYTLLGFWIWTLSELSRSDTEPFWLALFSLGCGYVSAIVYSRAWGLIVIRTQADTFLTSNRWRLFIAAVIGLMVYFAGLTLILHRIDPPVRGILIAVGFYFASYWLTGAVMTLRRVEA